MKKQHVQISQEFHKPRITVTHTCVLHIEECVLCLLHRLTLLNVIQISLTTAAVFSLGAEERISANGTEVLSNFSVEFNLDVLQK